RFGGVSPPPLAVASVLPSGENASATTGAVCCPGGPVSSCPVIGSQNRMQPLSYPQASVAPSGEKATDRTPPYCPLKASSRPVSRSQRRKVATSNEPHARSLPLGEKATQVYQ